MFFLHEARYRGWVSIFTYNFNNSIFSWSLTTILFHMKNIFDDQKNIITGVKKFREGSFFFPRIFIEDSSTRNCADLHCKATWIIHIIEKKIRWQYPLVLPSYCQIENFDIRSKFHDTPPCYQSIFLRFFEKKF